MWWRFSLIPRGYFLTSRGNILLFSLILGDNYEVKPIIEFWRLIYSVLWILSQFKLLNYYMSGLKLFCPTYSSHCCMYLFGKIVLKFCLFLFDMIWNWCAKWYFLENLIKIYHFEIWTYLGSILLKAFSFNTLVIQISLFDKVVYQNWSILFDSLLNMCICVHNIPYAICLCVSTTYSILYLNVSYQTTLVLITRNQCTFIS